MITLEQITCFTAVYEKQSYSSASKDLNKARSTVRERINAIEDTMNAVLFNIEGKKAVPTPIADGLYPRAKLLARQSLEFQNIALSAYQGELNELNIQHDTTISPKLLIAIEKGINPLNKKIKINWLQRARAASLKSIEEGEALVSIMTGLGKLHPNSAVGTINLGIEQLGVYTSSNNMCNNPTTVNELRTLPQLILEEDFNNNLRHIEGASDYEIITSIPLLLEKLTYHGWALLPNSIAHSYIKLGLIKKLDVVEVPNTLSKEIVAFYNLSSEASPEQHSLIVRISKIVREHLERK